MGKNSGKALADLEDRLEFFNEIGAGFFIKDVRAEKGKGVPSAESGGPGSTLPPSSADIGTVHQAILSCRKCALAEGRTTAVPGEGNVKAELIFVGEGPGHDEDIQGRPFVGRAGQLLTKIIQAMTYDRAEVFITNIVKCRPQIIAFLTGMKSRFARPICWNRSGISGRKSSSPWAKWPPIFLSPILRAG